MYIRSKTYESRSPYSGRSTYYYLMESYLEGSRVRKRTVAYLGKYPTVAEALVGLAADIERKKSSGAALRQRAAGRKAGLANFERLVGGIPKRGNIRGRGLSQSAMLGITNYWDDLEQSRKDDETAARLEERLSKLRNVVPRGVPLV